MASSRQSRLRARSEVSREDAKARSSDERWTILATPFRDVLRGRACGPGACGCGRCAGERGSGRSLNSAYLITM